MYVLKQIKHGPANQAANQVKIVYMTLRENLMVPKACLNMFGSNVNFIARDKIFCT